MSLGKYFKDLFQGAKQQLQNFSKVKLLNDYTGRLFNWSAKNYDSILYRACIDRIASQVAKLTPTIKGDLQKTDLYYRDLKYLLTNKPNEYMSRYDFFYKVTSMLLDTNNVFIYKRVENDKIKGFYPINFSSLELVEAEGVILAQFSFNCNGLRVYIPLDELIILRRHYNENDLFGSNQNEALKPIFEVIKAINAGMINSVESSATLRGYIKYHGQLQANDLKRYTDEFVNSYMSTIGGAGIGAIDNKVDFYPLNIQPQTIDWKQQQIAINNFSINYGVCENVLKGCAKEEEMNTFYELAIEPIMTQFSLEFTNKIFTKNAINEGNEILFTGNKLLFASVATKTALAEKMMPAGVFSINDIREMYGYNPISDGDKHIMSLNYIDLNKANEYQIGEKDNE